MYCFIFLHAFIVLFTFEIYLCKVYFRIFRRFYDINWYHKTKYANYLMFRNTCSNSLTPFLFIHKSSIVAKFHWTYAHSLAHTNTRTLYYTNSSRTHASLWVFVNIGNASQRNGTSNATLSTHCDAGGVVPASDVATVTRLARRRRRFAAADSICAHAHRTVYLLGARQCSH